MFDRKSGILLHISSLTSSFGIGDMGPGAYKFVDFLNATKQTYWQILPLNPTEPMFGNSPYSSFSAFATNPNLISPELMLKKGWLKDGDLNIPQKVYDDHVDYPAVTEYKNQLFEKAYQNFKQTKVNKKEFDAFCDEHQPWLNDFALFYVIKTHIHQKSWSEWPEDLRARKKEALDKVSKDWADEIGKTKLIQFIFLQQWFALKDYCKKKKVKIIGDIPIYVNFDSVDVWTHPYLFKLKEEDKTPEFVSGVPPDYFSETGQRWGNPVYDWGKVKETDFVWWFQRLHHNLYLFDTIRIDHFRGLIAYWEIPVEEETAVNGHWESVPYHDFFQKMKKEFFNTFIIAEDLGIITKDVEEAMDQYGFPGMKILLFAFNGDMQTHPYLPHNYNKPCIVYTGTHDNNTVRGWFHNEATDEEKQKFFGYIHEQIPDDQVHWGFIELAMQSKAVLSMIPLQDVLGLDEKSRMNVPSTMGEKNWAWRLIPEQIDEEIVSTLAQLTKETGRI